MSTTDPYAVLGLEPGAPPDEIRAAYRRLAHRYHPDRHQDAAPQARETAERRMREVNVAYDTLITGRYAPPRFGYATATDTAERARAAWSNFARVVSDEVYSQAQRYSAQIPPPPSMFSTVRDLWDMLTGRESTRAPLSVDEVAARLRISPRSVFRMLEKGVLKGFKSPGGTWRVPVDNLAYYLMGWEFRSRAPSKRS